MEDKIEAIFSENELQAACDEDKKFVSQAVAFVIGHTRNGFVALCASVATLLKEQARLKSENESLKQHISQLKCEQTVASLKEHFNNERSPKIQTLNENENSVQFLLWKDQKKRISTVKSTSINSKELHKLHYTPLAGCICDRCLNVADQLSLKEVPLIIGDRVVITGEMCGTVCYIGHIEYFSPTEIFLGLFLDEAVGDTNGTVGGKTYFTVPKGYGLFASLLSVYCLMN